jgi:light-harvesting complex 1 beta chain
MRHEIVAEPLARSHPDNRAKDSLTGFHGIYAVTFIVFLLLALASALCLQNWRSLLPGAEGARSMLDGVKSAVYTVISELT